jgi:tetratricopeptide (TPR) repeat protein
MSRSTRFLTAALGGMNVALVQSAVMATRSAADVASSLQRGGDANARSVKVRMRSPQESSIGSGIVVALKSEPKNAIDYYNRGLLKVEKLNDSQGALADFNRAITLDPKFAEAYADRGTLKSIKLNDNQGALADYNRAITLNPQIAQAYANRGLLKNNKLDDKAGAIQDLRQAVKLFRAQGRTQDLQKTIDFLLQLGATE